MALLTRAQLDSIELKTREIDVTAWGGSVRIRELTGTERDRWETSISGDKIEKGKAQRANLENIRARLVVLCLVDENNQRVYKDNEVYLLGRLPSAGLSYVFDQCCDLSGITQEDKDELENAVKNSQSEGNGDFGSV